MRPVPAPLRLLALVACLLLPARAEGHEGPPFPIVVDQRVGPYVVSVWTDPDVGTGTFFVVLEAPEGQPLPEGATVEVAVRPTSGRLDEVVYRAEPQPVRQGARYFTEVAFDRQEWWQVRVRIGGPAGGGEVTAEVEATPDGTIGPIGLLLYLLPFVAVGFLWLKAYRRRRDAAKASGVPGP